MSFNGKSILVFAHDYETTGLDVPTLGVLQAALCFATLHQDGSYDLHEQDCQLLDPGVEISAEASKIHGYTMLDVAGKPEWMKYLGEQFQVVNTAGCAAVVGYNSATFDNRIAVRAGFLPLRSLDLMKTCRRLKKELSWTSAKLTESYQQLVGKPLEKAHDAMADVIATLDLIAPAIKAAPGVGCLDDLILWTIGDDGTPDMKMPWGKEKGSKLKHLDVSYVDWLLKKCDVPLTPELREGLEKCL